MARGLRRSQRKPRRGPNGPRRGAAGKRGTNKFTPRGGAGVSGMGHMGQLC
jgi:hypothetical protein